MVQYAALACPTVDNSGNIAAYQRKRDLMVGILSQEFELAPPDGAFYLWAKAPAGHTGDSFIDLAIKNNMLMIPGSVFSERASHFRICYTVPDERLKQGAELLCRLAKGA
jgi:aspartate aminotransferase/aminotransferase